MIDITQLMIYLSTLILAQIIAFRVVGLLMNDLESQVVIKDIIGATNSVERWQLSRALQGRLRRDGTVVELVADKSSVRAAVTRT
jgi:hypothetical protein